ncbi:MAG: hypothetical protein M1830_006409 [Pleopsidium flavum]|nr:MAG: hypothetical protein M1830_006409 [Pleopsidium flavum]
MSNFGPLTLTRLARILIHSSSKDHRDIARRLLFTASDLHDSNATLQLISEGIRKSGLTNPQLAKPLRRLSYLAETSKNPSAMNLLGQILERQGEADKALGLYEDVVNAENDRYGGADDEDGNIAQAWLALGRIKAKNRDVAGAEAALKKAALEFDDPTAYFYLARFRNPKSDDYHLYNLKAASSGLLEAAHNLGIFYLQRSKSDKQTSSSVETKLDDGRDAISGSPQSTPTQTLSSTNSANGSIRNTGQELSLNKTRTTAYEWFAVAAEGGFASSQINLALLLRGDGSYVDGMAWLKHAEGHPDLGPEVERLKGQWFNKRVNLSGNVP